MVTCFGNIELSRARYRQGRDGKTIFPLELLLGIEAGFTPAAANMIGKQFATSGSSQGRTREMILERTGVSIGNEKLRKLTSLLAESFEPLREVTQLQELMQLIKDARKSGETPVLSVSRDGVALGLLHGASLKWLVGKHLSSEQRQEARHSVSCQHSANQSRRSITQLDFALNGSCQSLWQRPTEDRVRDRCRQD